MGYAYNYSVSGLQEPGKMNVLSLEQRTSKGNTFGFDVTGNRYVVTSCGEPLPTEFDAANLAINGTVTLTVELVSREAVTPDASLAHSTALPIDEWDAEASQVWKVIGERKDDLPCYECGEYTDTLIARRGYETRDVCFGCAILSGVRWLN
jgi:hypothetical protein